MITALKPSYYRTPFTDLSGEHTSTIGNGKRRVKNNDLPVEDRQEKVNSVIKMAYSMAREKSSPQDFEDLFQELLLAAAHAAKTFDPSKGCVFSTHAAWVMRSYISNFHRNKKPIGHRSGTSEEYVKVESYNRTIDRNGETVIGTVAEADTPREEKWSEEEWQKIYSLLTVREAFVVKNRIVDGLPMIEVARSLQISKQRTRIYLDRALNKIRMSRIGIQLVDAA